MELKEVYFAHSMACYHCQLSSAEGIMAYGQGREMDHITQRGSHPAV